PSSATGRWSEATETLPTTAPPVAFRPRGRASGGRTGPLVLDDGREIQAVRRSHGGSSVESRAGRPSTAGCVETDNPVRRAVDPPECRPQGQSLGGTDRIVRPPLAVLPARVRLFLYDCAPQREVTVDRGLDRHPWQARPRAAGGGAEN